VSIFCAIPISISASVRDSTKILSRIGGKDESTGTAMDFGADGSSSSDEEDRSSTLVFCRSVVASETVLLVLGATDVPSAGNDDFDDFALSVEIRGGSIIDGRSFDEG
jgi:hypothetical protein